MAQSFQRKLRQENRSENTIYSYLLSVRLLSEFLVKRGHDLTVDVSRDDIREFIDEQMTPRTVIDSKGRPHKAGSPATGRVRFKSLQQFFKHCVDEEELERSPMEKMAVPDVKEKPVPIVTDDVLTKLLKVRSGKSLGDIRDTALLRVFIDTPSRLAEVTGLKQRDVDLARQRMTVLGKGERLRMNHLGIKATSAIDKYLRMLGKEHPEWIGDDMPLWYGRQGRLSQSGVTNALHRMCDDAGIPRLNWHRFRHTYAHNYKAADGSDENLAEDGGWRSYTMLARYGNSARAERAAKAKERMSLGDRV